HDHVGRTVRNAVNRLGDVEHADAARVAPAVVVVPPEAGARVTGSRIHSVAPACPVAVRAVAGTTIEERIGRATVCLDRRGPDVLPTLIIDLVELVRDRSLNRTVQRLLLDMGQNENRPR